MADSEQKLQEAISLKVEGDYDAAVPILQEIIETDQNNVEARRQLGLIYGFQGLFDESLEELAAAYGLDSARADILCDLAMTHAMLGMFEEAKVEFARVLDMDPGNKTATQQMVYFGDMAPAS